jgi:uncharacterized protein (DUF2384 family)
VKRTKRPKIKALAEEKPRLFRDPSTGLTITKGPANGPIITKEDVHTALAPDGKTWEVALVPVGIPETMKRAYMELYRARTDKHIEEMLALRKLDGNIAEASLYVFMSARRALEWLTSPELSLNGRTPLKVARTKKGVEEVLFLLKRTNAK